MWNIKKCLRISHTNPFPSIIAYHVPVISDVAGQGNYVIDAGISEFDKSASRRDDRHHESLLRMSLIIRVIAHRP